MGHETTDDDASEPIFMVDHCTCGTRDCGRILFAMIRPQIETLPDFPDELASLVYFPKHHIRELIGLLERLEKDE